MKKILLILVVSFVSLLNVKAYTLKSIDLPYYVTINGEVINVKKIYVEETGEVVFNRGYTYNLDNDFTKYDESETLTINSKIYDKIAYFRNISYYGYQSSPDDLTYYLTQVVMWQLACGYTVTMTDELGNAITTYKSRWNEIFNYNYHTLRSAFLFESYEIELGEIITFQYQTQELILDNPVVDGIEITNDGYYLNITGCKVGEYALTFYKNYYQEFYSYSDGTNTYWQNLGGPQNISVTMNVKVNGSKVTINETYEGINGLYGDAFLTSSYEIYNSDNEYLGTIDKDNYLYVNYNNNYILKDVSSNEGYMINDDIEFNIEDDDYVINVTKYVIAKNISVNVLDANTYYVYLKSNNELYTVIDKDTNVITLPYGTYYIKGDNYYYEFSVVDDIDEVFNIETSSLVLENQESNSIITEVNNTEEINNTNEVENNEENNSVEKINSEEVVEEVIVNPQTGDNIYFYIKLVLLIIICISLIVVMVVL